MAVLDSCPKHNMVAYLEKTEGNVEFHEIIDFLKRSSINHALTVSPVVSTTFIEQFWTSAKSKTINNVRHITAKVAGKDCKSLRAINKISLLKKLVFTPNGGFYFLLNITVLVPKAPLGIKFLQTLSLLMRCSSERPSEALPTPSPAPTSEVPYEPHTDSSPAHTSETLSVFMKPCFRSGQENTSLKAKSQSTEASKTIIKHHTAYLKSVSLQQRFPRKSFSKKHRVHKKSVSKQGRKIAKGESSVQRDPLFDVMPEDMHMEIENAQSEGRTRNIVDEDKEIDENRVEIFEVPKSNREVLKEKYVKVLMVNKRYEKQKSTHLHNIEPAKLATKRKKERCRVEGMLKTLIRPRPTSTRPRSHIKPLPKIDPKDKGKKKIEEENESESESDGIPQAEKKFKQLESDEELARKVQEEWEAKEERNKIAKENAANEELIKGLLD
ncbi:hypothetical protein Tco_1391549 [Tanacetum coccineum]